MSDNCVRCGKEAERSAVAFGARLFCSPGCFEVWKAGRDIESLSRIDALEASNDANLAVAKEAQRLLDLREAQLADCTRAMREVATEIRDVERHLPADVGMHHTSRLHDLASRLDAVRGGK